MNLNTVITIFGWWMLVGVWVIQIFPPPKTYRTKMLYIFIGGLFVWMVSAFEWYGKKKGFPPGWWFHWRINGRPDTSKTGEADNLWKKGICRHCGETVRIDRDGKFHWHKRGGRVPEPGEVVETCSRSYSYATEEEIL